MTLAPVPAAFYELDNHTPFAKTIVQSHKKRKKLEIKQTLMTNKTA